MLWYLSGGWVTYMIGSLLKPCGVENQTLVIRLGSKCQ